MYCRTDIVETRKGFVQGRTITQLDGEFRLNPVDVFLGIPYALPPIGPRRWETDRFQTDTDKHKFEQSENNETKGRPFQNLWINLYWLKTIRFCCVVFAVREISCMERFQVTFNGRAEMVLIFVGRMFSIISDQFTDSTIFQNFCKWNVDTRLWSLAPATNNLYGVFFSPLLQTSITTLSCFAFLHSNSCYIYSVKLSFSFSHEERSLLIICWHSD